jgi:hypothetical protein
MNFLLSLRILSPHLLNICIWFNPYIDYLDSQLRPSPDGYKKVRSSAAGSHI